MKNGPGERYYTPEEYLALEDAALEKHEYFDGVVYAMDSSSVAHARIALNVLVALHGQLRGRQGEVFNNQIQLHVEATGLYTYPDLLAVSGEGRFESEERGILLNPSVLVEVLSPSTEGFDRGRKFVHYRKIPSLREYVLIAQDYVYVERFRRGADASQEWGYLAVEDLDATIELPSIGCTLALRDVCERVDLPPRPPLRAVYEIPPEYAANF